MKSKVQPYVLNVAEQIYSEIVKIKKTNDNFSNIQAIETFIGSEKYKFISQSRFRHRKGNSKSLGM